MDNFTLIIGLVVGVAVGVVSMLSLWTTVHRLSKAQRPLAMLAASAGIRLLGALLGFYVLAQLGPIALLGGLVGFVVVRTFAIGLCRTNEQTSFQSTRLDSR